MQKVVIDSDIIIDHFRRGSDVFDRLVRESVVGKTKVYLPGIVYKEINSGQDSRDSRELNKIEELPAIFEFIVADQGISQKAGFLVRDYPNLGIADAMVAATALELDARLATRNRKDFQSIKNLKFFIWRGGGVFFFPNPAAVPAAS